MRTLLATQHGRISNSSVFADQQGIAFVADAHYRPPLDPFSDAQLGLHTVNRMLPKLLFQIACQNSFSRGLENKDLQLEFNRNIHQPTPGPAPVHFQVSLRDFVAPRNTSVRSFVESFIMHSRLRLACSHAPSHSLCELPPLKPPLNVGTVVHVFSLLHWTQNGTHTVTHIQAHPGDLTHIKGRITRWELL